MEVVREGQGTVWLPGTLPAMPGLRRGDVTLNWQKVVSMILMPECANLSNDEWGEGDEIHYSFFLKCKLQSNIAPEPWKITCRLIYRRNAVN